MSNGTGKSTPRWARYTPQLQRADWSGFDGRRRTVAKGPAAGGPPASMFGAGVMVDDQGPTQAGGTLAGITAPGVSRDIVQSRYGPRIDLGPILRPRSTGANPLTSDPFQATSGVGGFFRRLLGDNADELNAQWQQARIANQLAAQGKADERAFELEKLNKQNEQELERTRYGIEARSNADLAVAAANRAAQQQWEAGAPQRAVAAEHAKATATFGDPILASNYLQNKAQAELERLQSQADLNEAKAFGAEAGGLGLGGRGGRAGAEPGWKALGDTGMLTSPEGKLYSRNYETGALEEVPMPGARPAAPDDLTEEKRAAVREKTAQLKAGQMYFPDFPREEPKIEQWNIPGEISAVDPQITGMVGIKPAMSDDLTNLLSTKLKPKTKKSEYIGSSSIPKLW